MTLERLVTRIFDDEQPAHLGTGWISGTLSVFLGVVAVCVVLCLRFPSLLVSAEARGHYPLGVVRAALELLIGLAFLMGFVSALLRRRKVAALSVPTSG